MVQNDKKYMKFEVKRAYGYIDNGFPKTMEQKDDGITKTIYDFTATL